MNDPSAIDTDRGNAKFTTVRRILRVSFQRHSRAEQRCAAAHKIRRIVTI